jgi:hypothetical protein
LSNECSSKLQSAQVNIEDDHVLKQLQLVKEAFELKEETEEKGGGSSQALNMVSTVLEQLKKLKLPYKADKLQKVCRIYSLLSLHSQGPQWSRTIYLQITWNRYWPML